MLPSAPFDFLSLAQKTTPADAKCWLRAIKCDAYTFANPLNTHATVLSEVKSGHTIGATPFAWCECVCACVCVCMRLCEMAQPRIRGSTSAAEHSSSTVCSPNTSRIDINVSTLCHMDTNLTLPIHSICHHVAMVQSSVSHFAHYDAHRLNGFIIIIYI